MLRAAGAEFEAALSFAGLNQLLGPVLGELSELDEVDRRALRVALGFIDARASEERAVAIATLALLTALAAVERSSRYGDLRRSPRVLQSRTLERSRTRPSDRESPVISRPLRPHCWRHAPPRLSLPRRLSGLADLLPARAHFCSDSAATPERQVRCRLPRRRRWSGLRLASIVARAGGSCPPNGSTSELRDRHRSVTRRSHR